MTQQIESNDWTLIEPFVVVSHSGEISLKEFSQQVFLIAYKVVETVNFLKPFKLNGELNGKSGDYKVENPFEEIFQFSFFGLRY